MQIQDIPLDDYETWSLISSGKTRGVFQCESRLVQYWLKKAKPQNLWELSAVISLVRPGALESGFADQYVKNKFSNETPESFGNPIIDDIFKVNNHCLIFQENLLSLGQRLAWSHLPETERLNKSDDLRKAVGKKDQAKILSVGKEFVDGCIHNGVSKEISDKLFEIIKNCGRYLFNLSHSMAYAYVSYRTSYLKTHYPLEFYTESLNHSMMKGFFEEEIDELIQDAKNSGIKINKPNINNKNLQFVINDKNEIVYGLKYIKYVASALDDIIENLPTFKHWHDVLRVSVGKTLGYSIRSTARDALIFTNCFSDCGVDPYILHTAINFCDCLTNKELSYLFEHLNRFDKIEDLPLLINEVSEHASVKKRKPILQSEIIILNQNLQRKSNPVFLEEKELKYLHTIVEKSAVLSHENLSTHNCYHCNQIFTDDTINDIILMCIIDDVKMTTIKTGKNKGKTMCKIGVHDSTGQLVNLPIFSETYEQSQHVVILNNTVQLQLKHNAGRGFFVKSVTQI